MPKKAARPGPRGLEPEEIVTAAVAVLEEAGPGGFSVRKVAALIGCDVMAVLYHYKSKEGLERAMADALNARLVPVDPDAPWRSRLAELAWQYRALALAFPKTFPLLLRFWVTGPADYRHAEMVYRALEDAGLPDREVVDCCFGWYASVLGLAAAEAGGLLRPAGAEMLAEVESLPAEDYPVTARLLPAFRAQKDGRSFELMVAALLEGIERTLVSSGASPVPGRETR